MEILTLGFPYSIVALIGGILIGGIGMFFAFGFSMFIMFLVCIYFDILRIDPILDTLYKSVIWLFPSYVQTYKENIQFSFPVEVRDKELERPNQRIFLFHPHGLFSASQVFHCATEFTDFPKYLKPVRPVCISWITRFPGISQALRLLHFVSSTPKDMRAALEDGDSLSVNLGGVREILYNKKGCMKLNIKEKKGVFRFALEYGIELVPVLCYGENELYEQAHSTVLDGIQKVCGALGFFLPFPKWRCIGEWWSLFKRPLARPIQTVIGASVCVERMAADEICEKKIREVRERYFEALRALYAQTHPSEYAAEIEIV